MQRPNYFHAKTIHGSLSAHYQNVMRTQETNHANSRRPLLSKLMQRQAKDFHAQLHLYLRLDTHHPRVSGHDFIRTYKESTGNLPWPLGSFQILSSGSPCGNVPLDAKGVFFSSNHCLPVETTVWANKNGISRTREMVAASGHFGRASLGSLLPSVVSSFFFIVPPFCLAKREMKQPKSPMLESFRERDQEPKTKPPPPPQKKMTPLVSFSAPF